MKQRKFFLKILVIGSIVVISGFLAIGLKLNTLEVQNSASEKISQENIIIEESSLKIKTKNEIESNNISTEQVIIEGTLKRGDSLYSSLRSQGISPKEIQKLKSALSSMIDMKSLPFGSKYRLIYDVQGKFIEFIYNLNPIDTYIVSPSASGELKVYKKEPILKIVKVEGKVESSLYNAMLKAEKSPELAVSFANIFAWQIDFNTELRRGDIFKLIVQEKEQNNFSRLVRILAAQYKGKLTGKHTAIFFKDSKGHTDYYTPEGKSLRKAFVLIVSDNAIPRSPRYTLIQFSNAIF